MLEKRIVFVEEPSMEVALEQWLPKLMNDADYEIRRFQCKDDLLKNLPDRLRAYLTWLPENWAILVLVDRDEQWRSTWSRREIRRRVFRRSVMRCQPLSHGGER